MPGIIEVVSIFDETLSANIPGAGSASQRTLAFTRQRNPDEWISISRIVLRTLDHTGAPLDAQTILFFSDPGLTDIIDQAPGGNQVNDLNQPGIYIRYQQGLYALWPSHNTQRSAQMRLQGQIIRWRDA